MTGEQRTRMLNRFDERRKAAPEGSADRALCKIILAMLGYSASVMMINKRSHQFRLRYGDRL